MKHFVWNLRSTPLDNYARFATAVAEVPGFKIFGFKSLGRFRVAEVISN